MAREVVALINQLYLDNVTMLCVCLLYTSDAADDLLCVDFGGRRTIKKKTRSNAFVSHPGTQSVYSHVRLRYMIERTTDDKP